MSDGVGPYTAHVDQMSSCASRRTDLIQLLVLPPSYPQAAALIRRSNQQSFHEALEKTKLP